MNKKILIFSILSILLISSCGNNQKPVEPVNENDKDYDGLSVDVDKDDNNNVYSFVHVKEEEGETIESNPDSFTVDYRYFASKNIEEYNPNLAKLSLLLASTTTGSNMVDKLKVLNNVYTNEESKINSMFVQIGCSNVKQYFHNYGDSEYDKNDLGGVICGEHAFDYGNKKYQAFIFNIDAYSSTGEGWISNFDMGSSEKEYEDLFGVSPNWDDKSIHKGFYVSAKRIYGFIKSYISSYQQPQHEQVALVTGFSRCGAIANLIGKFFKDEGLKGVAYTFAAPSTTTIKDKNVLSSYTNIHNLVGDSDLIPKLPLNAWDGFTLFGQTRSFNMDGMSEKYLDEFKTSYVFINKSIVDNTVSTLLKIAPTKESIYRLGKESLYDIYDSSDEAEYEAQLLRDKFKYNAFAQKLINVRIEEEDSLFYVYYSCRPFLIADLVERISKYGFDENTLEYYSPFFDDMMSEIISSLGTDLITIAAGTPINHMPKTYFFGLNFLQLKIN